MEISEAPMVILPNRLRVANFSSPHDFKFIGGYTLPACGVDRVKALSLETVEEYEREELQEGVFTEAVRLRFNFTKRVYTELDALILSPLVDVILCALPVVELCRPDAVFMKKVRGIRVADRITKEIYFDRFCI